MGPGAVAAAGLVLGLLSGPAAPTGPPQLSVSVRAAVDEGSVARVVISLDAPADHDVTVALDTRHRSAVGGADYEPVHRVLVLNAGSVRRVVTVATVADGLDERPETFAVRLSAPHGAVVGTDRALVTVADGDPPPRVLPQDATVEEPTAGNRLGFTEVRLSRPSGRRVVVELATRSGTARAGRDFVPLHPTVVFGPGQTSQPVSVELLADDVVEPPETVRLVVLSARHGRVSGRATITILDSP